MFKKYIKIAALLFLLYCGCKESSSFKFALFSDTHIIENSSAIEDLQAVVSDVNNNSEIKFVLVSGDITEINTGENLKIAKKILDGLNKPYYIIPGNHDTKWSGSGGANFRAFWGDDKFVFDYDDYRFIGFHQGPVLRMDDGHISLETLDWLKENLKQAGKDKPIILVMHYDLTSSIDNWFECISLIKDYNIKAIIHGHGHRNRLKYYNNIPGIMGRSTLRARSSSAGYTLFEIHDDSLFASERKTDSDTSSQWAKISLKGRFLIESVPDSILPDYSVNNEFPEVKLKWLYNSGYTMTASPVCDDENVYVGNISGSLIVIDKKSGKELWKFQSGEAIYGTAAMEKNLIVFTSADSAIHCIDANTRTEIWKVKTGNAMVSVPVIENDIVYVGSSDGIFRSLDLKSGDLLWEKRSIKGYVETKPLVYENKIIFGAWDNKLYALDKNTGKSVWTWEGPFKHPLYSPAACWPVAAFGKIFVAAPDRNVSAIDAKNGETIWRTYQWKFRETIGASEDGKYIFARSMTDSVIAFQSSASKAKVIWANNFGYGYDIAPSMPMEKDDTVFWGTKNGLIIAADSKTGKLKWKYKFQNYLINTVFPISDHEVIFSNIDGNVGLLSFSNSN
jgi:outer membrane protein assembly factor BamB/predicted phosphodiesterase